MSAQGVHKITEQFEQRLCDYTGAPYAVAVDNCSNALFLALKCFGVKGIDVLIPAHTYPAVPCEIIHADAKVKFCDSEEYLTGSYRLGNTNVWDCALHFTKDMYKVGQSMCLSFTGPYKHLKLGKGGAILTDRKDDYEWFKQKRFSGRNECSYLDDNITTLGWNFYMMPEIAAKGLQLMDQFYINSKPIANEPLSMRYPDLRKFKIYE